MEACKFSDDYDPHCITHKDSESYGGVGDYQMCSAGFKAAEREIAELAQLVQAQAEYIKLLGEEAHDHALFMSNRFPNWASPRYEAGVRLRERIKNLEATLKERGE